MKTPLFTGPPDCALVEQLRELAATGRLPRLTCHWGVYVSDCHHAAAWSGFQSG